MVEAMIKLVRTEIWDRLIMISTKALQALDPGRARNEVRTIFEDVEDDIEIPIYDIPVQTT